MIDADELLRGMDALRCPISEQEANEMINFADHDKGIFFARGMSQLVLLDSLLSFEEFLIVFTQISAITRS
jgi:hypothetical protein